MARFTSLSFNYMKKNNLGWYFESSEVFAIIPRVQENAFIPKINIGDVNMIYLPNILVTY